MSIQRHSLGIEVDPLSISDLLSVQRVRNARAIGITIVALDLATIVVVAAILPELWVLLSIGGLAACSAAATAAILRGYQHLGVFTLIISQLLGHIGVVVALGTISILPLFSGVLVLFAAATLPSRRIAWVFVLALLTVAVETSLGIAFGDTRQTLLASVTGGTVLLVTTAVISLLHVRENEKIITLAEERDILRQRAVEAARESEAKHRLIADNTNDLIALVEESGQAEYLSPSHQRCLGIELRPKALPNLVDVVHPEDRDKLVGFLHHAHREGRATGLVRLVTTRGEPLTYEVELSRVMSERVAVIGRDVTLRLALEEHVRKAQRMEALDRLAGGIAHDFNNLLGVVTGASDLVFSSLGDPAAMQPDIQIIRQALESAKGLTQQLLAFSRKQVVASEVLDARAVLRALSEIVQRLVGKSITVAITAEPECPLVKVPRSQLEQIVMNLAANARDAMPAGGQFSIAVHPRELAPQEVAELGAGAYVEIVATDTGTGIAPDLLPHMFEPFFTTKPEARGTGLGLATSYGIARQCGGTITIDTELGKGSSFRVLLPVAESGPVAAATTVSPPKSAGRSVLLVDDDPAIIKLVGRMLTTAGFEVASCGTLAEAEQELADPARRFDVLVTDVMLGSDRGTALIPLAQARWPDIRIVVISGYAPEPAATAAVLGKSGTFLAKPFGRQALFAALGVSAGL